eukprot:Phypoly_transcript_23533.p1 GENE.Phypoly_transcript_23533~~Phypoly_transcript_23533.p1  ORF type:complete len:158 (+),score=24.35 Phypoly_transcript_23533:26-475(+)
MEVEAARAAKITEYENFINTKLMVDLKDVESSRDSLFEQISQYLELKSNITLLQENKLSSMNTKINLGSEFYMQAKVPDTSKIFVNVGLGFHVEFTLPEAIAFIDKKEAALTTKANALTESAGAIRARIKLMYQGIHELRALSQPAKGT